MGGWGGVRVCACVFRYKGARDGGARGHRGEEARVRKMSVSVSFLVERVSVKTRLWQAQCITILVCGRQMALHASSRTSGEFQLKAI